MLTSKATSQISILNMADGQLITAQRMSDTANIRAIAITSDSSTGFFGFRRVNSPLVSGWAVFNLVNLAT